MKDATLSNDNFIYLWDW